MAPCSAAILHARERYLASRPISLPTAVTASTGMPYRCASSTRCPSDATVLCSYFEPTNTDIATAEALRRSASSIETVILSRERSAPITLGPPETRSTIGVDVEGGTQARCTPLVSISESQYFSSGAIALSGSSSFSVGPKKYPWSTASMRARPSCGFIIRASLFLIPQSMAGPPPDHL